MTHDELMERVDEAALWVVMSALGRPEAEQDLIYRTAATVESIYLDGQESFIEDRINAYRIFGRRAADQ